MNKCNFKGKSLNKYWQKNCFIKLAYSHSASRGVVGAAGCVIGGTVLPKTPKKAWIPFVTENPDWFVCKFYYTSKPTEMNV